MQPLINIRNVKLVRGDNIIFDQIDFTLNKGENALLIGSNGSGKSSFLKLIKGELYPHAGQGDTLFTIGGKTYDNPNLIRDKIGYVSAEQQQFYPRMEIKISGREVIESGFEEGIFVYKPLSESQLQASADIIAKFRLEPLLDKNFNDCSNGQQKKLLLARAIVKKPALLILDEFENGLDQPSLKEFFTLLKELSSSGITIIICTHHMEIVPSFIKKTFLVADKRIIETSLPEANISSETPTHLANANSGKILVELNNCNVFYGFQQALHNIDLKITKGRHYYISGNNGSGKSTLLKLIMGDVHPVVSNGAAQGQVTWRLADDVQNPTLWDIKNKIGYVGPHLQTDYYEDITFSQVVLSGLFSSIGIYRYATPYQLEKVQHIISKFNCSDLAQKSMLHLSYGQARKALILRALINDPELLILDEPFDGLDQKNKAELSAIISDISRSATILIVTHIDNEIPGFITDHYKMESGKLSKL